MLWINPLFYCLSRLRLLRAAGAEDLRPPLRRHDGLVPHVHHLRHVLHAPGASQGTDAHYGWHFLRKFKFHSQKGTTHTGLH